MKTWILTISAIFFVQLQLFSQTQSADANTQIGDYIEGGVVFHIYQSGEIGYVEGEINGLVCGIEDLNDYPCSWGPMDRPYYGDGGIYISLGTSQTIGTGKDNTQKIINHFGNPTPYLYPLWKYTYAAFLCDTLTLNGYDDWFLPSKSALLEICELRDMIDSVALTNGGENFTRIYDEQLAAYWSSSERSYMQAYFVGFTYESCSGQDKEYRIYFVRPVREFSYTLDTFSVIFKDWNDSVLGTQTVYEGDSAIPPEDPTREGYTFTGWDADFSNVTSDLTVTAQYSILQFTVTFIDYDGTVLKTEIVDYGNSATPPEDPTREGYLFAGWDTDFSNVTSDLTVTAQYSILQFTVTFIDYDGTVLKTEIVDYGNSATPPEDPTREGYLFAGWDTDFSNVTSDLTVTAQYSILQFTVTFIDYDATVLKTEIVDYGNSATPPEDPTREGYTFTGWDTDFSNVTSDLTVTAQYSILQFTVTFIDYDATVLKTEIVDYGNSATPPEDPTREGYLFAGWDTDFSNVTSDLTVTAQYSILQFTVTFIDYDATVLKTEIVDYGNSATPPEDPTREGYTFTGWDTDFSNVTSDLTVTAQYTLVVSMENVNIESLIKIYPNPVKDNLFIEVQDMNLIQNSKIEISIFNITGKRIFQSHNIKTKQIINLNKYAKGIYIVSIGDYTKKIIIE